VKADNRAQYVTRDIIMNLLTDNEVASVTHAGTTVCVTNGDSYVDLENLGRGVQHVDARSSFTGTILPQKSVQEKTWNSILEKMQHPNMYSNC
jgi:hypothetical protein